MNLKEETLEILEDNGKSKEDVRWAGCIDFSIPLSEFWSLADQEYDSGYGAQEVAADLIVAGDDFWLERYEYDGAEGWDFKEMPTIPSEERSVKTLIGRDAGQWWATLKQINKSETSHGGET